MRWLSIHARSDRRAGGTETRRAPALSDSPEPLPVRSARQDSGFRAPCDQSHGEIAGIAAVLACVVTHLLTAAVDPCEASNSARCPEDVKITGRSTGDLLALVILPRLVVVGA